MAQSDIDDGLPEWHIANVNKTHRLVFNKYCIYRPQYILLTADPSNRQTSPLDHTDFRSAWTMLQALEEPHYVIFNCGKEAGGSRMHKHMQVFEQNQAELLPDRLLRDEASVKLVPFKYSLSDLQGHRADEPSNAANFLLDIYRKHLSRCADLLDLNTNDDLMSPETKIPHNVILTKRWIITIPRRAAGIDAATANAAGFLGLVWVPVESTIELWKKLGPTHVLASLGVPAAI